MSEAYSLSIDDLLGRLPHRYPFLLIDRVLECRLGESIVALKNVTANEPFFVGHFPGMPVMPGVLLVEAMAQAGGTLAWESAGEKVRDKVPYLAGVEKARFKQPVRPGDQLIITVKIAAQRQNLWRFEAAVEVDGKLVAEAEILLAAGKRP
jgi:3-hydroxyacyl-[acyl-carrier-protein] dehydratase